jgi:hypothetical protein
MSIETPSALRALMDPDKLTQHSILLTSHLLCALLVLQELLVSLLLLGLQT